eukprot:9906096-Lingulodinium_polyedra.AAC.1
MESAAVVGVEEGGGAGRRWKGGGRARPGRAGCRGVQCCRTAATRVDLAPRESWAKPGASRVPSGGV